jgi:NAD(P)-dependent dehydrogenase (short-subunit alcohol dehydrogenase family)
MRGLHGDRQVAGLDAEACESKVLAHSGLKIIPSPSSVSHWRVMRSEWVEIVPRLQDKVVVLTGASSGIGRATALALAREGAILHLVARREQRLQEVCAAARTLGGQATPHPFDVRDADAFARLAEHVRTEHGRIDVLINNSGVGATKTFLETTDDDWQWTFDTNFQAIVTSVREFLPMMLEQGQGTIVNVASIAGVAGSTLSAYTASKFAVVGLSEALLIEYGERGLNVIVVCPGLINTEIAEAAVEAGRDNGNIASKMGQFMARFGAPPEAVGKDIVKAILRPRFMVFSPMHANVIKTIHQWLPDVSRMITRRIS